MATIVIDGVRRDVNVEREGDGYVVTVDGRRHVVGEVSATAGTLAFLVDRASHVAHVSNGAVGLWISLGGHGYRVALDVADADRPVSTGGAGNGRLEAPMPGAIVAVHVAVGDRVRADQPVVVLESMKMHNEIVSPVDGVVKRVGCKPGEQVAFGRVLVEIEAGAA
jgi:acetyl/propionyl-CoA carboxylase alpha subunit